jgi:hypothetical protein
VKCRWLIATAIYAALSVAGLFAPWPEWVDAEDYARSDWDLLRTLVAVREVVGSIRLLWMFLMLGGTAAVWGSARRGLRAAHGELALALALGALAYPFVAIRVSGSLSAWIGSSAAAFVLVFAAVLGRRALALQRVEAARQSPLY